MVLKLCFLYVQDCFGKIGEERSALPHALASVLAGMESVCCPIDGNIQTFRSSWGIDTI